MRRYAVTFILSIVAAFVLCGQENRQPRGESLLNEGLRLYGNYMDLGDTTARSRAVDNVSECLVGLASIYSDRSESMSLSKELYQWAFDLQGEALTEAGFTAAAGLSVLDYHLGYPDLARKSLEICDLLLEYFTEIKPTAISGTSLAGCLSAMGMAAYLLEEPERAVRYYDWMEKQPLPADADVLATAGVVCGLVDYSMIQSDLGNLEKALDLLKKVKAIYDSSQFKLVATLSRFSQASGTVYRQAGLHQEAVEFFETAAVINHHLCGEFDLNTIHSVKQVALTYGYCGRFDEANQLFKNLVEEIGAIYGKDSREMFSTWVDWSVSLIQQHDYETAIQACQIANDISKKLDVTLHQGYVNGILAALYKGDEKLAATFAADAFGLVKDYCKRRLAFLDERSRDRFWAIRGVNYLNSIMAGASSPSDGSGVLFDAALLSKGLLMNASRELDHFFRSLQEGDALQTYRSLKQAKDRMAYLYSGTREEQVEARRMQEDAAGLERRLMVQVKQYGDFLQYTDCSWKDVAACLGPDDVCVEFVRFTLSEKSRYYATVLVPGKNPVNVELPDMTDDLLLGQRPEALYSGKSDLYVRYLNEDSTAVHRLDVESAAVPRWRILPSGDTAIVYVTDAGVNSDESVWSKASTWQVVWSHGKFGTPEKLFDGAYRDGVSAGNALAVSGARTLRVRRNGKDTVWFAGEQACNASLSEDGSNRVLFLDFDGAVGEDLVGHHYATHEYVLVTDSLGSLVQYAKAPDGFTFDHTEWAYRSGLVVATLADINGAHTRIVLLNLSNNQMIELVSGSEIWHPSFWMHKVDISDNTDFVLDPDSAGVYYVENGSSAASIMRTKMELFWRYKDSTNLVVIGSSRSSTCVDPLYFSDSIFAVNMSMFPNSMELNRFIFENYVLNHMHKLKYMITSLDLDIWWRTEEDVDNYFFAYEYKSYPGFVYDENHDFWKDGYPENLLEYTENGLYVENERDGHLYHRGVQLAPTGKGWQENPPVDFDSTWLDTYSRLYRKNFESLKRILGLAKLHNVNVVGIVFPQSPGYRKTGSFGRYGIRRSEVDSLMQELYDLEKVYGNFRVMDENKMGNHDYPDSFAVNHDHLLNKAAKIMVPRIENVLKEFSE